MASSPLDATAEATEKMEDSLIMMEKSVSKVLLVTPRRSMQGTANFDFIDGATRTNYHRSRRVSMKQNKGRLWQLSKTAWIFLALGLAQAVIVTGIQIVIAIIGRFTMRLDEYVACVEVFLNETMNMTLGNNSTYPSFGADKEIYVFFFIFLVVYNFGLGIYAIVFQRIVEVFAVVIINILAMLYAGVQVYQFRGFQGCDPITVVGYLSLANALVLLVHTAIFSLLLINIYVEFGWKVYKFVNCNPALRYYYRIYEIFLCSLKLVIVFSVIFLVGQMVLIFGPSNYEFPLSILFIVGMLALLPAAGIAVRRESHLCALGLFVIGVLLIAYNSFKIWRYISRSCPLCEELERQITAEQNGSQQLIAQRLLQFENLTIIASVNIVLAISFTIIVIKTWSQYGKGLADHFYINGYFFDRLFKKPPRADAYLSSSNRKPNTEVHNGNALQQSKQELKRESSLLEDNMDTSGSFSKANEIAELDRTSPRSRISSLPPILEYNENSKSTAQKF